MKKCDVCGLEYKPIEPDDTVCEHCGEAMLEAWLEDDKDEEEQE